MSSPESAWLEQGGAMHGQDELGIRPLPLSILNDKQDWSLSLSRLRWCCMPSNVNKRTLGKEVSDLDDSEGYYSSCSKDSEDTSNGLHTTDSDEDEIPAPFMVRPHTWIPSAPPSHISGLAPHDQRHDVLGGAGGSSNQFAVNVVGNAAFVPVCRAPAAQSCSLNHEQHTNFSPGSISGATPTGWDMSKAARETQDMPLDLAHGTAISTTPPRSSNEKCEHLTPTSAELNTKTTMEPPKASTGLLQKAARPKIVRRIASAPDPRSNGDDANSGPVVQRGKPPRAPGGLMGPPLGPPRPPSLNAANKSQSVAQPPASPRIGRPRLPTEMSNTSSWSRHRRQAHESFCFSTDSLTDILQPEESYKPTGRSKPMVPPIMIECAVGSSFHSYKDDDSLYPEEYGRSYPADDEYDDEDSEKWKYGADDDSLLLSTDDEASHSKKTGTGYLSPDDEDIARNALTASLDDGLHGARRSRHLQPIVRSSTPPLSSAGSSSSPTSVVEKEHPPFEDLIGLVPAVPTPSWMQDWAQSAENGKALSASFAGMDLVKDGCKDGATAPTYLPSSPVPPQATLATGSTLVTSGWVGASLSCHWTRQWLDMDAGDDVSVPTMVCSDFWYLQVFVQSNEKYARLIPLFQTQKVITFKLQDARLGIFPVSSSMGQCVVLQDSRTFQVLAEILPVHLPANKLVECWRSAACAPLRLGQVARGASARNVDDDALVNNDYAPPEQQDAVTHLRFAMDTVRW